MSKVNSEPSSSGKSNLGPAILVVNAKSRHGKQWFDQAKKELQAAGIELISARAFRNPKEIPRFVKQHLESGVKLVIAGGGDGTMAALASILQNKDVALGVLPMGTGNSFARDLHIPVSITGACKVIIEGRPVKVDVGRIGDKSFLNVATVGLTTKIAEGLSSESKRRFGRAAYFYSIARALFEVRPFHAKLTLDNKVHEFTCLLLVIGAGRLHAGPFPITPDASLTGGNLSIYALASSRKWDFLKFALKMRGGRHVELEEVKSYKGQVGEIETRPTRKITVDGEVCLRTPSQFGVDPLSLRVLAPADFEE